MKMFRVISGMSFLFCLFATASQAQSVESDFDRSFDFSKLKTFNFAIQQRSPDDPLEQDPLNDERIKSRLVSELQASGFKLETGTKPDFTVAYYVTSINRFGLREYSYGPPGWFGSRDITVDRYTEGTLTVDLINTETNQLVWRGRASGSIELQNIDKKIHKSVKNLAKQFVKDSRKRR